MQEQTQAIKVIAITKPVAKPTMKVKTPPFAPHQLDGTKVITASATQIVAVSTFGADKTASRACHRGPKDGYPVRRAIDSNKNCVVIPAGEFARIRTGLIVDQPVESWTQSSCLDSQAAVSKVAVEKGEIVAYVTGVGQAVTIYEGNWLVLVRLGGGK